MNPISVLLKNEIEGNNKRMSSDNNIWLKRIKKTLKYIASILLVYVILCLITPYSKFLRNRSINNQISYLSKILDRGYDNELQRRFPEGKLFSNAILALSTIEYCEKNSKQNEKYAKIVDDCIKRIQSDR